MNYNKPFTKKVNVLGSEWTIILEVKDTTKIPYYNHVNGWADVSVHEIHVGIFQKHEINDLKNIAVYYKRTLRHEIIHAFLMESGLDTQTDSCRAWATNEEMVDWIAGQFPKIQMVLKELDAL